MSFFHCHPRTASRSAIPLLASAALALIVAGTTADGAEADEAGSAAAFTPSVEQLRSATYRGIGDLDGVTLTRGEWQGEPLVEGGAAARRVILIEELVVNGDLDRDGTAEAVAGLSFSSGGTGDLLHLAAMAGRADAVVNLGSVRVGDRVDVMDLGVEAGEVILDAVVQGPEDPMCCPTLKVRKRYALRDGGLVETTTEELGTFSIADIEEIDWHLVELGWREPVPAEIPISATFVGGTVSGSGGCNRYTGSYRVDARQALEIGPLATTRRACPGPRDELEGRFLQALERATRFQFLSGRLLLDDGGAHRDAVLVFSRPD
jgi:heat shock protein HslJ